MKILTLENSIVETDQLGDEVDDLNFWVLDYSNDANTDYFTKPLLFLESFSDLKLDIKIGNVILSIPRGNINSIEFITPGDNFHFALGKTTVPVSLPSTTNPPFLAILLCASWCTSWMI